jgi:hypothetical protein
MAKIPSPDQSLSARGMRRKSGRSKSVIGIMSNP